MNLALQDLLQGAVTFHYIERKERITFAEFFNLAEDEAINVFANSDMLFDVSLLKVLDIAKDEAYCLLRWNGEVLDGGGGNDIGADVWVVRGKVKPVEDCEFGMGLNRCDAAIAERLQRAGYTLKNPCLSIITKHHHASNVRTYWTDAENTIPEPWVRYIPPTKLP